MRFFLFENKITFFVFHFLKKKKNLNLILLPQQKYVISIEILCIKKKKYKTRRNSFRNNDKKSFSVPLRVLVVY